MPKRLSIDALCEITGLVYCDEDCPCGESSHLFFTDFTTPEEWQCANGWPREDVEQELKERRKARDANS